MVSRKETSSSFESGLPMSTAPEPGLFTQPLGDGLLVADPRSGTCHHLDATARLVLEGREAILEERHGPELGRDLARVARGRLHDAGLVAPEAGCMTRQQFLRRWGAAAAVPLVLTLALPRPAQAASALAPTLLSLVPNSGASFTQNAVVLTGTGFTGTTVVLFTGTGGGAPRPSSSFVVDSDTQISALTPVFGPGSSTVTVYTPRGISNGQTYTFL